MRRSSVVAPLLLIGIGGLFLARNMYPDLPLIDYFARYWPFLIVLWGGLRVIEVLVWAATDKPLPARGTGGGEWVLVVMLIMFGGSLHAVRGYNGGWWPHNVAIGGLDMFGESYEYPISAEKQAGKNPHVVIESFRGNAKIVGADTDTVKVTGHRTIRSLDQNGANSADREANFELTGDSNEVIVRNNPDRLSGGNVRITAEMEITVPRNATIEAHGRVGDFDISDINGNVEVISDNAGVRLQNLGGDARIDLNKSDIIRVIGVKGLVDLKGHGHDIDLQNIDGPVTVAGAYSGVITFHNLAKPLRFNGERTDLSIEKIPGNIRMTLSDFTANNLVGPIHITGRSRDVNVTNFTSDLSVSVDRGDINLRPGTTPLGKIDAQTRTGEVTMAFPPGARFELTATTSHGDVTNDYGSPIRTQNDGRGSEMFGSTGGANVTLHTEHGNVTVRRASSEDKPIGSGSDDSSSHDSKPIKSAPLKKTEQ